MFSEKHNNKSSIKSTLGQYEYLPINEEAIIFSSHSHSIHFLNSLSKLIWEMYVHDDFSQSDIAKEIANAFSIPVDIAQQDIHSTIQYWVNNLTEHPIDKDSATPGPAPLCHISPHEYAYTASVFISGLHIEIKSKQPEDINLINEFFGYLSGGNERPPDHTLFIHRNNDLISIYLKNKLIISTPDTENSAMIVHNAIIELLCQPEEWLAILHAGGVTYNNQTCIFPALGGSGKSTLIAALIKNGFSYLNDDVIPLLDTQELLPIPLHLCIKSGSWELLKPLYPQLDELEVHKRNNRLVKYLPPFAVDLENNKTSAQYLILPEYNPQAERTTIQAISTSQALQGIINAESLIPKPFDKGKMKKLVSWVQSLHSYSMQYRELPDAVESVKRLLKTAPNE